MRFTPVEDVTHAKLEDIKATAAELLAPHFPQADDAQPIKFAVQYEHRACKELDRIAVINAIVECVKQVGPCQCQLVSLTRLYAEPNSLCSRRIRLT